MTNRCIVFLAILLYTTQVYSEDAVPVGSPCKDGYSCETCVLIRTTTPRGDGNGTCMWEVTSSGKLCVEISTPSQELSNVAFNQAECATIPSTTNTTSPSTTTTTTPPTPSIRRTRCSEQTECETCVSSSPLHKNNWNPKCVWVVTYYAQICVSLIIPITPVFKIARDRQQCKAIPLITTTELPTTASRNCIWDRTRHKCSTITSTTPHTPPAPERDPCLNENTCESCVLKATSQGIQNLSTCLWLTTPSDGHCASTFTASQEIDKIALTLNGCKTSAPPPTCEQQETCEACVTTTRLQRDKNETCVWEVKTTGQRCVSTYSGSQEITNIVFSQTSCTTIQQTNEKINSTLMIPEQKCECRRDSSLVCVSSAESDYINELDVDNHEFGSTRGAMRRKYLRKRGERGNHVANNTRRITRMQKRLRKLGGSEDPCLVGRDCESCVRTPNGDDGLRYCIWKVTSKGSSCVTWFAPSQEILKVSFNEERCKELGINTQYLPGIQSKHFNG